MNKLKRTLIMSAGIASVGIAGLAGVTAASALTGTDSSTRTTIIDKLVSKFKLNKDEVQAVFDADRTEHQSEMKAKRTEALKTALSDGKITQVQYDHIVTAQTEIDTLIAASGPRDEQTDAEKAALKTKFEALHDWMKEQNISVKDLGIGHGKRGPGPRDDM